MWLALYSSFPKSGCNLQQGQPVNKQELDSIHNLGQQMDPGSCEKEESQKPPQCSSSQVLLDGGCEDMQAWLRAVAQGHICP